MDYNKIQELINAVSNSKLTSLEIEADGIQIKMRKDEKIIEKSCVDKIQTEKAINELQEKTETRAIDENEQNQVSNEVIEEGSTINSPIVGTFYNSPAPEEDAFVSVGDKVSKGQTLCIIEAMKLMNEIEAENDCEILEILVKNEQMVEYGQPLFRIAKK